MEICVDTDFVIDLLRNKKGIVEWLDTQRHSQFYITQISLIELYRGAYKHKDSTKKLGRLLRVLSSFTVIQLTNSACERAGSEAGRLEKMGRSLDFKDILIGISAREYGCSIKTNNKEHFERIEGLKVV